MSRRFHCLSLFNTSLEFQETRRLSDHRQTAYWHTMLERQNEATERLISVIGRVEERLGALEINLHRGSVFEDVKGIVQLQNDTLGRLVTVSESIDRKLGTLEKYSNIDHDDRPFAGHALNNHEPAWRGVYETLVAIMKDKVDRWKSGMDSSLIFVGLFVTIITAFLIPVLQNLAPDPSDLTNDILTNLTTLVYEIATLNGLQAPAHLRSPDPFQPSLSDEIVSLFFYSALILSLITAIFSVFGRQWVEHLTKKPEGKSYNEKSQRLNLRDELANRVLKPILDSLHPILIVSITFFIAGLLFQLWTISLTVDKSVTLILTSVVGSGLIVCASIMTIVTFLHGSCCDESPFTMPTSLLIRHLLPNRLLKSFKVKSDSKDLLSLFSTSITQMDKDEHFDHASSVQLFKFHHDVEPSATSRCIYSVIHFLGSDASQKAKLTMAWNLLDLTKVGEKDYNKLRILETLQYDTPSTQDEVRLGFLYVRMVLLLRCNGEEVDVCSNDPYLGKYFIRDVFVTILLLPNLVGEKWVVASRLGGFAEEDPHFLDRVNGKLLDAIITDDEDRFPFWRGYILPHLAADTIITLIRRISQKDEISHFLFEVLQYILVHGKRLPPFSDNLDFSRLIAFLMIDERRYYQRHPLLQSPTDVLLSYLGLMDNDLLNRQRGLPDFLWTIVNEANKRNDRQTLRIPHQEATCLLQRINQLRTRDEPDLPASDLGSACFVSSVEGPGYMSDTIMDREQRAEQLASGQENVNDDETSQGFGGFEAF